MTSPSLAPDPTTSGRAQARQARAVRRTRQVWAWGSGLAAGVLTALVAAPGLNNEFFRDEAVTADAAARTPGQILDLVGTLDVGHTLLYLIVSVLPIDPSSVAQVRIVALVPVMLAGALLAAWTSMALGRAAGVLTALTWPLMPATVGVALYARDYGLATLFAVLASLALIGGLTGRAAAGGSARRVWWGYTAAVIVMVWANLFALLLLPAHALAVFLLRRDRREAVLAWGRSVALAVVACVPLVLLVARQPDPINWVAPPLLRDLIIIPNRIIGGAAYGTNDAPSGAGLLTLCLLALVVVALARTVLPWVRGRRITVIDDVTVVVAGAWLIVPIATAALVSLERPIFVARYLWFVAPAVVLLLATLARRPSLDAGQVSAEQGASPRSLRRSAWVWGLGVPLMVLLVGAAPRSGLLATEGAVDYRGAVAFIAERAQPGDVVVDDDPSYLFARSGLEAAAGGTLPARDVLVVRSGAERGDIPPEEYPEDVWPEVLEPSDRVWVVTNDRPDAGPREAIAEQGRDRVEDENFGGLVVRLYEAPASR